MSYKSLNKSYNGSSEQELQTENFKKYTTVENFSNNDKKKWCMDVHSWVKGNTDLIGPQDKETWIYNRCNKYLSEMNEHQKWCVDNANNSTAQSSQEWNNKRCPAYIENLEYKVKLEQDKTWCMKVHSWIGGNISWIGHEDRKKWYMYGCSQYLPQMKQSQQWCVDNTNNSYAIDTDPWYNNRCPAYVVRPLDEDLANTNKQWCLDSHSWVKGDIDGQFSNQDKASYELLCSEHETQSKINKIMCRIMASNREQLEGTTTWNERRCKNYLS